MSCISAARTMSSSWLSARPRRRPTPIACAATFGSAAAELPARRSERICSRTSRTWRSDDRRCQRERARTRSCAIASALAPSGASSGIRASPRTAPEARLSATPPSARWAAAAGVSARALDRAEEGVEAWRRGGRRGRPGTRRRAGAHRRGGAAARRRTPASTPSSSPSTVCRASSSMRAGMPLRRARSACRCARVRRPVSMSKSRLRAAAKPVRTAPAAWSSVLLRVRCTIGVIGRAAPVPRPQGQELVDPADVSARICRGPRESFHKLRGRLAKLPRRVPARVPGPRGGL